MTEETVGTMGHVATGPWPASARFRQGALEIAGVTAEELADTYGTPLLVLDEEDFRSRCRAFAGAFPRTLYAVKAFTARGVIRTALEEGLGLLAATGGELVACLRAGADGSRLVLHGNNKSDRELELAVETEIGQVVIDNPHELQRLERIAAGAGAQRPVLLRVIPGVEAGTHSFIETGDLDSKFGTPIESGEALRALERLGASEALRFLGLHAHVGSQILQPDTLVAAVDVLLDLASEAHRAFGLVTEVVDVGGGFGVRYTDEDPPRVEELVAAILPRVATGAKERGLAIPDVQVEPGRALVANPVVTLYRVGSVKRIPGVRTFVAVDGGMSDNIRPVLYGARYTVAQAAPARGGLLGTFTVVGKHCESGDVLARDASLPEDVSPGDLLALAATGAYGYSMASTYNRVGRPAVVAVRDGETRLWLRRETDDDLDRLEHVRT
jgi:diaminopimelate decarboxylase